MLTEIYIETLDEELADQVWEAWNSLRARDGPIYSDQIIQTTGSERRLSDQKRSAGAAF